MIVKNESKVIPTLIESVSGLIDCYCICDTGSTDDTVEVITALFKEKGIPGKVVTEPFRNFGYNRSFAMKEAAGMSDYLLLLDADMQFVWDSSLKGHLGHSDTYFIMQGSPDFCYQNARVVRNTGKGVYIGVTHEYYSSECQASSETLQRDIAFIRDHGNGGCKDDKFERDIRLLTQGIVDEPHNKPRYLFYLANSYHDTGKHKEAIETYKQRIDAGGWIQEKWFSYYRIGLCKKELGNMEGAVASWLEAYNVLPRRLESLYQIINYYRCLPGHHSVGWVFVREAERLLGEITMDERNGNLFNEEGVFTWKIWYEKTILAYYMGQKDIRREAVHVLEHCRDISIIQNMMRNMEFYQIPAAAKVTSAEEVIEPRQVHVAMEDRRCMEQFRGSLVQGKRGDGFVVVGHYSGSLKGSWCMIAYLKADGEVEAVSGPLKLSDGNGVRCVGISVADECVRFRLEGEDGGAIETSVERLNKLVAIAPWTSEK
jgi:glycosyltransferase involved in cell wall biosynthesis